MDFDVALKNKTEAAELCLKQFMPKKTFPEIIFDAMAYSLFAKGKRLRPVLLMSAFEALFGRGEQYKPFAAAIEMIHTYSLIHDDLPAMDNDDFRRGIPTNHKVFGEANAILAGDGLLNGAFEIMSSACVTYQDIHVIKAMCQIAKASGTEGMIKGQALDLLYENKPATKEILGEIHKNKTAALLSAALAAGGYLAGANEDTIQKLVLAGEKLGVAFQIQDDILDVSGNFCETGKAVGSDEKNHKTTYVSVYGLHTAQEMVVQYSKDAEAVLDVLKGDFRFLKELFRYLVHRTF